MKRQEVWMKPLVILALQAVFFALLFYTDNKYQTPPPYGKSGVITLSGEDLERENPIFLIDGWLLTDGRVENKPTYIGEFSNLQRGDWSASPHGEAHYRLTLRYDGPDQTAVVDFPQLSSQYAIFLDGAPAARGVGNGRISFLMTAGDHVLEVETSSRLGYYSGMYFPPALGTDRTLFRTGSIQTFAYALAFLIPLTLAVFTLFVWKTGGKMARWFGLLCFSYALYVFWYFVFLISYSYFLPAVQDWFLIQSLAMYSLCFCVSRLTILASGVHPEAQRWIHAVLLALPAALIGLCLLIPYAPWAVAVHGRLTDLYYMATFVIAAFFAVWHTTAQGWEQRYTQAGCSVFGAGLLANLLFSNRFEPIRFFWQFEWCGLFLVFLFGAMMVSRSRRILRENEALTNHLEEQVEKRTEEVMELLEERKAFFSDMAHDLKAPVFATQSFIEAIRRRGVGVDKELWAYLDQAEAKQWEIARRLQGLSTIHELDRIEGKRERLSLREALFEVYAAHHGEAEVQSVYLSVEPPLQDAFLMAQPEKLSILFENLIYNALKARPRGGSITVSARAENDTIRITVEDTGCGIPDEELPLVFHRFYVGTRNRGSGTGLGLYIVNGIVKELGGTIRVKSAVGQGTRFIMELPRAE